MPDIEYDNFLKISLFKLGQEFRRLDADERERGKEEFTSVIDELSSAHQIHSYSTVGTRADADMMLVQDSPSVDTFHETAKRINATLMGRYLEQPYSYLSIRRKSRYKHGGGKPGEIKDDYKYLIIYPMTKTRPWYEKSMEERQKMMNDHFRVGKDYPMVKINTSYAFGLDDTEFVLGFEMDDPSDFVSLVMDLREVPAAQYTATEIPIFTTIRMPIAEALDAMV
jgi:chlorite dismutase